MGCQQSKDHATNHTTKHHVTAVGATERLVGRAERLKQRQSIVLDEPTEDTRNPPKLDESGHLMPEEVVRRTSSSIQTKTVTMGTDEHKIRMEYAFWTQRGYYPEDPHKENQDECGISLKFASDEHDAMFAVYDGHGAKGHSCSRFSKRNLPKMIAKHIKASRVKKYKAYVQQHEIANAKLYDPSKWPLLSAEEYKECCRKGFLECNQAMHDASSVEDKFSGTTAITVNFHGNMVVVSNVGDSRAVLGHHVSMVDGEISASKEESKQEISEEAETDGCSRSPTDGKFLAIPLSRDQTPYRKDERERVKKLGAEIKSIDQMEGQEEMHENWGDMVLGEECDIHGDPPRIWVKGKDYPGTAFSRSLGDYLAEEIGVTAEPEMIATELTSNDHILVIASDGIFEFVTNAEVIDMCAECETALHACEKLVKAAYERWLVHENRTDDITVIVGFMSCSRPPAASGEEGTTEDLVALSKSMYGNKPIRDKPRGSQDNLSCTGSSTPSEANATRKCVTMADIFNDVSGDLSSLEEKKSQ